MKHHGKAVLLAVAVLFLCCVVPVSVCSRYMYSDFTLEEYSENCLDTGKPVPGYGGDQYIDSRADAVKAARAAWEEYGEVTPEQTAHCEVFFDSENSCWLVTAMSNYVRCSQCSPFHGVTGGVYHVILSSDGRVLGMWAEM